MSDNDVNFWSLSDLLSAKEAPMPQQSFCDRIKALDLAIEQSGIQEINGRGRLVNADNECALKLIAECLAEHNDYQVPGSNSNPIAWFDYDSPLCLFGWTEENLPDFAPESKTPELTKIIKMRRNLLDEVIDKIVKVEPELDCNAVFLRLREMALEEVPPFKSIFADDATVDSNGKQVIKGSIAYTNDKNELAFLTKSALRKRLSRR